MTRERVGKGREDLYGAAIGPWDGYLFPWSPSPTTELSDTKEEMGYLNYPIANREPQRADGLYG